MNANKGNQFPALTIARGAINSAPLDYPGVEFGTKGLILPDGLPFDRWQAIVATLPKIGDGSATP